MGTPLVAQVVTIDAGQQQGHGYMFRSGSSCYVIMPKHVAGARPRVRIFSGAPVVLGNARVETPFWPNIDLAIGVVRGAITPRCTADMETLSTPLALESGGRVELVRLRGSGEVSTLPMRITATNYLTVDAETVRAQDEIFQGTSGAMLFAEGKPAGMIVESLSPSLGRFIRIEEINLNVRRWVERRGVIFEDQIIPAEATLPTGLPFEVVEASNPPLTPDFAVENVIEDGIYVFQPTRTNTITFSVEEGGVVPLSRVRVFTDPDAGYALPRRIEVFVSTRADGSRPRFFVGGEMANDGVFDRLRSAQNARWITISIKSAWSDGPVRVDRVVFE